MLSLLHFMISLSQPVMRIYEIPEDEFESSGETDDESDGYQSNDKQLSD